MSSSATPTKMAAVARPWRIPSRARASFRKQARQQRSPKVALPATTRQTYDTRSKVLCRFLQQNAAIGRCISPPTHNREPYDTHY